MAEKKLTLFENAVVHTMDPRRPRATWFTTLGDRFQRVGENEEPPEDVKARVDLGGRCVVPGFIDSHIHFFQTGLDLLFVDLAQARNLEELAEMLISGTRGKRSWVFAHSFEEDKLQDADRLTRSELDRVFPYRPVWINRVDYHSAVVNTAALRRLEIPKGTPGLLLDNGEPNGILRAQAYMHAKTRVSRLYPIEVKERAVKAAAAACVKQGVTAVHALEGGKLFGDEGVQTVLKKIDGLPLDVTLFLQEMNTFFCTKLGFEHLGGCVLIDGSIGSYTAALDEDYVGLAGARGVLYEKSRDLSTFIEEAHAAGAQLAFHAIGPRAIEQVLSAYERAFHKSPRYDHRHRIEHFELATDDQIERCAEIGIVVAMQPTFEYLWGGPGGMYAARIGERWRQTNRLKTIVDKGVVIAGGSDANVTPPGPLLGIHAAVNHPNPEQRLSVEAALRMMTIDAAYAGKNDHRHGSIQPGKEASFAVLDDDLLVVPEHRIRFLEVCETWSLGRRVYQRNAVEA